MTVLSLFRLRAAALLGACILSACAEQSTPPPEPAPQPNFFDRQEAALRASGRMKIDRQATGAPFTAADLARNFERVAFGAEFTIEDGEYRVLERTEQAVLRRWDGPVLYRLSGEPVPADYQAVARFARQLSAAASLEIRAARANEPANLDIAFVGAETRHAWAQRYLQADRSLPLADLYLAWAGTPTWPCAGEFYFPRETEPRANHIDLAVIYIRDEVRGLSRQSCIEEEIAQILGLGRDDSSVRPSIFNDDEEFALLTRHDALLLRILYDSRLRPGMSPATAMPIVRQIARTLVPRQPLSN